MLQVKIKSPGELVWKGSAEAVSSENSKGSFDVLPGHANFVSMIQDKPIVVHTAKGKEKTFKFERAVILVNDDVVSVYTHLIHKRN